MKLSNTILPIVTLRLHSSAHNLTLPNTACQHQIHSQLRSSIMSEAPTTKLQPQGANEADPSKSSKPVQNQGQALLEEDDEFEDFPVEGRTKISKHGIFEHRLIIHSTDWTQEDTEVPGGNTHLWEESWDDDDENEDFSKQLRYGCSEQTVAKNLTILQRRTQED